MYDMERYFIALLSGSLYVMVLSCIAHRQGYKDDAFAAQLALNVQIFAVTFMLAFELNYTASEIQRESGAREHWVEKHRQVTEDLERTKNDVNSLRQENQKLLDQLRLITWQETSRV